ncbi:MAG: hypothetical protein DRH97_00850 [Chloroflexi bacterium]|nr:MAG: hypothetical protein DRH97_00850 [Chloroflexota bacterium]
MKCKTLAEEYGVTAMSIGRLRKQFAPDESGDLSAESVEFIRSYFAELQSDEVTKEMEEAVKPQFVDSVCSYTQEGRHEVECKLREDGDIITVRALIPFSSNVAGYQGRPMRLEVIDYEGVKYYRHASLAGMAWSTIRK